MQQNTTDTKPKRPKLFGIRNPILKAIFLIAFVLLTGGIGLIILILAYGGDYLRKHKKDASGIMSVCLAAVILTGCTSTNVQTYSSVDLRSKTITVPAGSSGLKGELKKGLSEHGWKMSVYSGPEVLEGQSGNNTRLQRYDTFNTRYSLLVESRQYDVCFNFSPAINYELVLIDNKDGSEVIAMDGRDCQNDIVQQFMNAVEGKNNKAAGNQESK